MPHGLLTDFYELAMAAGYVAAGKHRETAAFDLFCRRLPARRNFLLAAGLQQAVDYLLNLRFSREEIEYLRGLPQLAGAPAEFFRLLADFRFTGDLWAMPEGTPAFAGEPLLLVRAPMMEAQIAETYLLATIGFQTMIASKAARIVAAAGGRPVIEFGTRRAHSPEAGVLAGRAAYIGGCVGTSNTETGFRYGIPVFGTAAHSWVMAFQSEMEAFRELQKLLGPSTVQLIDTYDTEEGARHAASLGRPLWGVRLDSGDLAQLSRSVRRILDQAGLHDAQIMASGDLNERRISELSAAGLPIDSFGVGTDLSTSSDESHLGVVYKLVEIETAGKRRLVTKLSEDKQTWPGAKQVFRYADRDVIGLQSECLSCETGDVEALLQPVIVRGELAGALPSAAEARQRAQKAIDGLPSPLRKLGPEEEPYRVEYSQELQHAAAEAREQAAHETKEV
jgi:nicotinate phosphoribosyltransferase